ERRRRPCPVPRDRCRSRPDTSAGPAAGGGRPGDWCPSRRRSGPGAPAGPPRRSAGGPASTPSPPAPPTWPHRGPDRPRGPARATPALRSAAAPSRTPRTWRTAGRPCHRAATGPRCARRWRTRPRARRRRGPGRPARPGRPRPAALSAPAGSCLRSCRRGLTRTGRRRHGENGPPEPWRDDPLRTDETVTDQTRTAFADVSRIEEASPGEFTAVVDPGWTIGGKPNGGYLLAMLGRAAERVVPHEHILAASAHYLRSPDPGLVTLSTEVLRTGRSVSQVRARMTADGRPCVEATFTVGTLDPEARPYWSDGLPGPVV